MNKIQASNYSKQLELWAKARNFNVIYSYNAEDMVLFEDREVHISTKAKPENRLYSLLHECGHIKEYTNSIEPYFKKYPTASKVFKDARFSYSYEARIEAIEEEINAWRRGEEIAKELNISLNVKKYRRYGAKCVMGYVYQLSIPQ